MKSYRILLFVFSAGLAALLYYPIFRQFSFCDLDASYMVAQIRSTGKFCGWLNGYYFLSALVGLVNSCLNLSGRVYNDYLLAYRLVIAISALGILGFSFLLMVMLGCDSLIAFIFTLFLAFNPGVLQLLGNLEDNVQSSCMNMQYLTVFMLFVTAWSRRNEWPPRRLRILIAALPISLFLAVIAHHQNAVLLTTPFILYFVLGDISRSRRIAFIGTIYSTFGILFFLLYVALTISWHGGFELADCLDSMKSWFAPNSYYRGYYFFNQFGWNFARQGNEILKGLSLALGGVPQTIARPAVYLGLFVAAILIAAPVRACFNEDKRLWVLCFFIAVHIPHSLVYESANIERWDAVIPGCVIILGVLAQRARNLMPSSKWRIIPFSVATLFLIFLFHWNIRFYLEEINMIGRNARAADFMVLKREFRRQVDPQRARAGQKSVLVLSLGDFERFYYSASTYFSYHDCIFGVDQNGRIFQSSGVYPVPREISRETFRKLTAHSRIIENPLTPPLIMSMIQDQTKFALQ